MTKAFTRISFLEEAKIVIYLLILLSKALWLNYKIMLKFEIKILGIIVNTTLYHVKCDTSALLVMMILSMLGYDYWSGNPFLLFFLCFTNQIQTLKWTNVGAKLQAGDQWNAQELPELLLRVGHRVNWGGSKIEVCVI